MCNWLVQIFEQVDIKQQSSLLKEGNRGFKEREGLRKLFKDYHRSTRLNVEWLLEGELKPAGIWSVGPAAAGSILTARSAPTPGRRCEVALVCLHSRGVGRWQG